jgi:hypothetical protein
MGRKYLLPLSIIVLLVSCIPLRADPFATDRRDSIWGSPIELFKGSLEAGIQTGPSGLFTTNSVSAHFEQTTPMSGSSESPAFGDLPLFSARLLNKNLPAHIGVLVQDCSVGPICLYGVGLIASF